MGRGAGRIDLFLSGRRRMSRLRGIMGLRLWGSDAGGGFGGGGGSECIYVMGWLWLYRHGHGYGFRGGVRGGWAVVGYGVAAWF